MVGGMVQVLGLGDSEVGRSVPAWVAWEAPGRRRCEGVCEMSPGQVGINPVDTEGASGGRGYVRTGRR